jgi:hypothetical protein
LSGKDLISLVPELKKAPRGRLRIDAQRLDTRKLLATTSTSQVSPQFLDRELHRLDISC